MNRIEFMTQLAALLQDISVEERREAMQYYNDYFDDAGVENEARVILELGSPQKVAATIKADLGEQAGNNDEYKEFSESGYSDARFEEKESPVGKGYYYNDSSQEKPQNNKALKVLLIIAIIVVGAPVVIPVAATIIALVVAVVILIFAMFAALVIMSISIAIVGISLFFAGLLNLVPALAVGLALLGTGLILTVVGVVATIASIKLCVVVFPGIVRGIVWVCRRPFQGRAVA